MKPAVFILNATFAACTCPLHAIAATPLEHPAVIVTSTRLTDDSARLPASVSIITAEKIARSPASTLPELLAREAGITTRSLYGNHAARATIDMRGFGAASTQNTLILLDGRRLNDVDLSAVDFAAIPLESIERIEIIRGGGGVLYGDGAVGGTVNIITKKPGSRGTSGSIIASFGSHQSRRWDATATHGKNSLAANVFVNSIDSDGYRRNNALEQNNLQADLRWQHDNGEWFLKLGGDDQSVRLPGERRVDPGAGIDQLNNDRRGTSRPRDFADQTGGSLTFGRSHFLSADQELILDLGYRKKNQKAFFDDYDFGGAFATYYDTDLVTTSFTPRLKTRHHLFDRPGTLIAGIDYYHSYYDSDRSLNPSTANTPIHRLDVTQTSLAIYGQDTSEISEQSLLTVGGRLQRVGIKARDEFNPSAPGGAFGSGAPESERNDTQHMLELGLRHRFNEKLSLFGRLSRSVRFATIDEFFQTDPNSFLQAFSPLKPQTAESLDLGTDYAVGDTRWSIAIYRMNLHDEIHFNPSTFANENLDPTRRQGTTMSIEKQMTETSRITANYSYTRAVFRSGSFSGNEVPLVARDTGALSYLWTMNPKLTFAADARYIGKKRFDNDQSNTFQRIPAYTMVDIKIMGKIDTWRWQASVNNVFNKQAFDYGIRSTSSPNIYNAYPLPERIFSMSLGKDF